MAEQAPLLKPNKFASKKTSQKFPCKAFLCALFVVALPFLPSQAPPGFADQSFFTTAWELLHLLFVGIAVSYGLFSRKNTDPAGGDKDLPMKPEAAPSYVSQMLHGSSYFDDDEALCSPHGLADDGKVQSWSSSHHPNEPVVMVANNGSGNGSHGASKPLCLPVRSLKSQPQGSNLNLDGMLHSSDGALDSGADTVLPSPIPWRSRSGNFDTTVELSSPRTLSFRSSASRSPNKLSPSSSLPAETWGKTGEDLAMKRSSHKFTPPPPPPPPPYLGRRYASASERKMAAAKSFKEELKDHSTRGRGDYSQSSHSFNSTYHNSVAKPRSSFDGSSSLGKSVRTTRPREAQSQPFRDATLAAPEETFGYRPYQPIHIPRFQHARASDQMVDTVTVSSDDSESSDEDDITEYSDKDASGSVKQAAPEVDENEVDRKAEEFITRFREQIRLQRIESIKKSTGQRGLKHAAK